MSPPRVPLTQRTDAITAAADAEPIPVYRTQVPPAATLRFAATRGAARGEATLRWRPTDAGYALTLDSAIDGGASASQTSDGAFDIAGLAPQRYVDRRTRRAALATNFGRDTGQVGFSGSARRLPLVAGVQDRVSWIVQLAAVLAAEGTSGCADGADIRLPVVGLRGEADVWAFRCSAPDATRAAEPVVAAPFVTEAAAVAMPFATDTAVGAMSVVGPTAMSPSATTAAQRAPGTTVRLVRTGTAPYDLDIEVWLDPARHHLPVRIAWRNGALGTPLEMTLIEFIAEP